MSAPDFSRLVTHATESTPPAVPAALSLPVLKPTPQQSAFLSCLLDSDRNIAVEAKAGTGKTTLILMGIDTYAAANPHHEIIVCAYSKPIQLEIDAKIRARGYDWRQVGCQTIHAMGKGLLQHIYRPTIDDRKILKLIDDRRNSESRTSAFWAFRPQIVDLVSVAKQAGVGCFADLPILDRSVWYDLAEHFDVDFDGTTDIDAVVAAAQEIYRQSLQITDIIDYNDMVLMPLIKSIRVKYTKDLLLGDEWQDTSRARQALARKFVKPDTGRVVIVGDRKQAIFGFAGADDRAMQRSIDELDAVTLPLSVTWRCPKQVVKLAQTIVPDIEAAESAPEGQVVSLSTLVTRADAKAAGAGCAIYLDELVPGQDAVLCRNNAPLVPLAFSLIRAGIPAKVEGRKIGEGLQDLVTRWQCRGTSELLDRLESFREREIQKHTSRGDEAKAQEAGDRVDTLKEIIAEVNRRGYKDVQSVLDWIDRLFADGAKAAVILATYHKSKGREWERVFLFEHASRCPSKAARQDWQKEQERNLAYVAYTRAKDTLVFVG